MSFLGIDIGSRFIKAAFVENCKCLCHMQLETSYDPLRRCQEVLRQFKTKNIVATGYGRHLLNLNNSIKTITEIKAFAIGTRALVPECKTIIDIGGQDTKVISLDEKGIVKRFEMNDKCSAGTGRFLEIMAHALGYKMEEFSNITDVTNTNIQINSMCTVFAESEVISLITNGIDRKDIAYAIHKAIAKKVASMAKRSLIEEGIVLTGGCARNNLLKNLIEQELNKKIYIPENPNLVGAYGAALFAEKEYLGFKR